MKALQFFRATFDPFWLFYVVDTTSHAARLKSSQDIFYKRLAPLSPSQARWFLVRSLFGLTKGRDLAMTTDDAIDLTAVSKTQYPQR